MSSHLFDFFLSHTHDCCATTGQRRRRRRLAYLAIQWSTSWSCLACWGSWSRFDKRIRLWQSWKKKNTVMAIFRFFNDDFSTIWWFQRTKKAGNTVCGKTNRRRGQDPWIWVTFFEHIGGLVGKKNPTNMPGRQTNNHLAEMTIPPSQARNFWADTAPSKGP